MVSSRGITRRITKYLDHFPSSQNGNFRFHFDKVQCTNNLNIVRKDKNAYSFWSKLPAIVESAKKNRTNT